MAQYQAEYRGVVQYYRLAYNLHRLNRLKWVMETSLAKTLAKKFKTQPRVLLVFDELKTFVSDINWDKYFTAINVPDPGDINLGQPNFIKEVGVMLNDVAVEDWKAYLKWNMLNRNAEYISSAFVEQDFEFYSKTIRNK